MEPFDLYFCIFLRRNMNVSLSWPQGGGRATAQKPRWLRKLMLAENLQTEAPSYLRSLTLSSPWFTTHSVFICCCCHPQHAPARVLSPALSPSSSVRSGALPLETNPIFLAPCPRMTCANCPPVLSSPTSLLTSHCFTKLRRSRWVWVNREQHCHDEDFKLWIKCRLTLLRKESMCCNQKTNA